MLAQFAQTLPDGTINIIGGGATAILPKIPVLFIAGTIQTGWGVIGSTHKLRIELHDENGTHIANDEGRGILAEAHDRIRLVPTATRRLPAPIALLAQASCTRDHGAPPPRPVGAYER
jgi:hypothetical protein